jgi:hypothetical protein
MVIIVITTIVSISSVLILYLQVVYICFHHNCLFDFTMVSLKIDDHFNKEVVRFN